MAEDTVVKEQLTEAMIEGGSLLTEKLDEMGLPVAAAMWLFVSEINEWRLLFASPELPTGGPQAVYRRIAEARQALEDKAAATPMSVIGLLNPNDQLVQLFQAAFQGSAGVSRVRFSENSIDGHFIEDALIYRITPSKAA